MSEHKSESSSSQFTLSAVLLSSASQSNVWGPSVTQSRFSDIPFAPFNKAERLGRISDWNMQNQRPTRAEQKYAAAPAAFTYKAEEDENTFSLVDNKVKPKQKFRKPTTRRNNNNYNSNYNNNNSNNNNSSNNNNNSNNNNRNNNYAQQNTQARNNTATRPPVRRPERRLVNPATKANNMRRMGWGQQDIKEASIKIQDDWKLVEEIDLDDLAQNTVPPKNIEDVSTAGVLDEFKDMYDQLNPINSKSLLPTNRQAYTTTTSRDPVMEELIKNKAGNIYGTDVILSVLMAAPRSSYSWDIVVTKDEDKVVFDKRFVSRIDFLTVNENWNESTINDKENINHGARLSEEATYINQCFTQQVLSSAKQHQFEQPNPYAEDAAANNIVPASVAYKYRRFNLDDDTRVVVRCEVNAFATKKTDGEKTFMTLRALNEFDPKATGNSNWRQSLQTQIGSILATEMKNNSNKLARWTSQSLLSGVDMFKLGFVTRVHPKDSSAHVILKVQTYKPTQFATQIGFTERLMWGTFKQLIERIRKLEHGKYLLFKHPSKSELHLYRLPDTWQDEEPRTENE